MRRCLLVLGSALVLFCSPAHGQAGFLETFDDLTAVPAGEDGPGNLVADGWIFRNQSEPAGSGTWSDGDTTIFSAHAGAGYLAVRSSSVDLTGALSQWAILPPLANQAAGDLLTFQVRAVDSSQVDVLEVRYAPGGGTDTGSSATDVGDFTQELAVVDPIPVGGWSRQAVTLPGDGRIALRYRIDDVVPFGFASYIGIDTLAVNEEPPPDCNSPPLPDAGETVTWSLLGSPWEICADTVIPVGGTVVVEAGAAVQALGEYTVTLRGRLEGSGAPATPIRMSAPGPITPLFEVEDGTLDLAFAEIDALIRPASRGSVLLADCLFHGNGAVLDSDRFLGEQPSFVRVDRCLFEDGNLALSHGTLAVRDTTVRRAALGSSYSYVYLDGVAVEDSPGLGMSILHDDQPVLLDDLAVTNCAGPALSLSGANRGNDFLLGENALLEGCQYPVVLGDGGFVPGSIVPAAGNTRNYVLWDPNVEIRGPATWPDVGVPYVIEQGIPSIVGNLDILEGTVVRFGRDTGFTASAGGALHVFGAPGNPVRFERLDPAAPWIGLGIQNVGTKLEHCVLQGSSNGINVTGTTAYMQSCTIQDNDQGATASGFASFVIGGTRFLDNLVGVQANQSASSQSGGVELEGFAAPNSFSGNTTAVSARFDQDVTATNNWWGDPSGPTHPSNPTGTGDPVTDGVDFLPFRDIEPDFTDSPPRVDLKQPFFYLEPGKKIMLNWEVEDDGLLTTQYILLYHAGRLIPDEVVANGLAPDIRSYEWIVPDIGFQVTGQAAWIRVVARDDAGLEGWDEASLLIPTDELTGVGRITSDLTGPFLPGENIDLCWEITGTNEFYGGKDLFLFLEADQRVIGLGNSNTGCLSGGMTLPYVSTDSARVGLRLNGSCCNRARWFFSDCFSIRPDERLGDAPPQVTVTSPGPGDSFVAGSTVPISWTASDDEGLRAFDLQASYDGGATWHLLVAGLTGTTRSWDWQTARGSGFPEVRVRVVAHDARFQNTTDCSGVPFTLTSDCQNDADGDGYGSPADPACGGGQEDCDDTDPDVHPDAEQICDGKNNDCNDPNWPDTTGTNESDDDGDGLSECDGDCDDDTGSVWGAPGEVPLLLYQPDKVTLSWDEPADLGADAVLYDTIRATRPFDFVAVALCRETDDGTDLLAEDTDLPSDSPTIPVGSNPLFYYLVRAENACFPDAGPVGEMSDGTQREARTCP